MATANQLYFDSALRHQVQLRRYSKAEVRRVLGHLEKSDREIVAALRERLARLGGTTDFTSTRMKALLTDMRLMRAEAIKSLEQSFTTPLLDFAKHEVAVEQKLISAAVPIEIDFATVSVATIREAIYRRPFQGHLLGGWFENLEAADQRNLTSAVQMGISNGESIPQIVRRVAGTKELNFSDGALAITRRNAESVVRTAVNHASNQARETLWEGNEDIIQGLRVTATLDGRTSAVCRALDGKIAPIGDKPLPKGAEALKPADKRPPFHVGCRTIMVAIIDGVGILGSRPSVTDTRRREDREIDFRAEAKKRGVPIQEVRAEWARENVGQVPAATTYSEWLTSQKKEFQEEVLGKERAELFRSGKIGLDEFVDHSGKELTLDQLREIAE